MGVVFCYDRLKMCHYLHIWSPLRVVFLETENTSASAAGLLNKKEVKQPYLIRFNVSVWSEILFLTYVPLLTSPLFLAEAGYFCSDICIFGLIRVWEESVFVGAWQRCSHSVWKQDNCWRESERWARQPAGGSGYHSRHLKLGGALERFREGWPETYSLCFCRPKRQMWLHKYVNPSNTKNSPNVEPNQNNLQRHGPSVDTVKCPQPTDGGQILTISGLQVKKQHVCVIIPTSTASLSDWTGLCSRFSGGPSFSWLQGAAVDAMASCARTHAHTESSWAKLPGATFEQLLI